MLDTRVLAALVVVTALLSSAPSSASNMHLRSDREQILQLERDWCESFVTNDAAANERIVADDFIGTGEDGKRFTKRELLAELKSYPPRRSDRLDENDVTIRFYGNTAIVNGSETWQDEDGKSGRNIWTDVFLKRDGKWQVVSSQDMAVSLRK